MTDLSSSGQLPPDSSHPQALPPTGAARVARATDRLVLGIADGWLKADGEQIYTATDLKVGLSSVKAG